MGSVSLDEVDRHILYLLQQDARNQSATNIARQLDVSANTVRNRIERLEEADIITGYNVKLDYDKAGLQLELIFLCTARISERDELGERVLNIPGVVNVKVLMTGERNIHAHAVGVDNDDITRIAKSIDNLGVRVNEEVLMRDHSDSPLQFFGDETITGQDIK